MNWHVSKRTGYPRPRDQRILFDYTCGVAMRATGFLDAALERLELAAYDERSTSKVVIEYARTLLQAEKPDEAIAALGGFIADDPRHEETAKTIVAQSGEMLRNR